MDTHSASFLVFGKLGGDLQHRPLERRELEIERPVCYAAECRNNRSMSEYLLGIGGIAVSVALFFLGYRQTIGAKKERVRSANNETEKILVRRTVLEEYTPRVEDIRRLVDGKARDFRVRPTDLLSEGQFLNNIFTRVVETDFIPQEQREKILDRLSTVIGEAESQPVLEEALEELSSQFRSRLTPTIAMPIMAVMASAVGVAFAAFPKIRDFEASFPELLPMVLGTAAGSLTIIVFSILVLRIREQQQEEPSKSSALSDYVVFERDVVRALRKAGFGARVSGPRDHGYDLVIEHGGRKIVVEVKAWRRPVPARVVSMVLDRLREAMVREEASEGILVTRSNVRMAETVHKDDRIKLMTLPDLRNYLVHGAD